MRMLCCGFNWLYADGIGCWDGDNIDSNCGNNYAEVYVHIWDNCWNADSSVKHPNSASQRIYWAEWIQLKKTNSNCGDINIEVWDDDAWPNGDDKMYSFKADNTADWQIIDGVRFRIHG